MLRWALLFLALAIAAAFIPGLRLDPTAEAAAKVLCFGALALFVLFIGVGRARRRI